MSHPKLEPETVRTLRQRAEADDLTAAQLARQFDLSRQFVYRILRGDVHLEAGGPLRPVRRRLPSGASEDQILAEARRRLTARAELAENGCLLWTGGRRSAGVGRKGYFTINIAGRTTGVHRWAYRAFVGPIPPGTEVDHRCHSDSDCFEGDDCLHRRCLRPEHLRLLSHGDNVRAGKSWAIHGAKTHCKRGHPFDPANTKYVTSPSGTTTRKCRACGREWMRRHRARRAEAQPPEGVLPADPARCEVLGGPTREQATVRNEPTP